MNTQDFWGKQARMIETLYKALQPLLFSLDPERSHALTLGLAKRFSFLIPQIELSRPTKVWNLEFKNPIGLAAGFDKNAEYLDPLSRLGFGFIEVGTVTPLAQPGNPKPRLWRLPQQEALKNHMGLNNLGVEVVARNIEAFSSLRSSKGERAIHIGASFTKNTSTHFENAIEDYMICYERLEPVADYLVADVSCPNTADVNSNGNLDFLEALCMKLRSKPSKKPLLFKLSPDWHLTPFMNKLRLDGVICGNSANGLSGKPLFPKALQLVSSMRKVDGKIPIIACGGISSAHDLLAMQDAGANLFQIYTALIYKGPGILHELGSSALTTC